MHHASDLDLQLPMMMNGVRLKTSPTNHSIVQSLRLSKDDGTTFCAGGRDRRQNRR